MSDINDINFLTGGPELLDRIAPLWRELRRHHADISPTWRQSLLAADFDARKADLLKKSANGLLVLLAIVDDEPVAYCVSSISHDEVGEVDSIFVCESHRRLGIARRLMNDTMTWFGQRGVKSITVEVLAGNDEALRLYEGFGFHARTTRMRYIP